MPQPKEWDDWSVAYLANTGRIVEARCQRCGHNGLIDPLAVVAAHGEGFTVRQLRLKVTCADCRRRGDRHHDVALWVIDR